MWFGDLNYARASLKAALEPEKRRFSLWGPGEGNTFNASDHMCAPENARSHLFYFVICDPEKLGQRHIINLAALVL